MATAAPELHHSPTEHDLQALAEIERKVLWLAVRIVDHANRERPSQDPLKVGGHQASSASIATIMTALWFWDMRAGDRVSVKPHASPVLHAIQYLLGGLERKHLTTLRDFGGLQAYPSRTKDPFPVDYSTGSVGLGAAAPLFGALTARYAESHFGRTRSGRFISLIGDAELDEGNVWEAINDPATAGLGDAVWIIDLNRQSLDRVVPLIRAGGLGQAFRSAGWDVIELKYGRKLREAFEKRGGKLLRRRIDELSNPEYQFLFSADESTIVEALLRPLPYKKQRKLAELLAEYDGEVGPLIRDLGGHDLADLTAALAATRPPRDRPTVIFAYTIKGYRLPIAGHPLNHSAHLTAEQIEQVREELADGDDWAPLRSGTAAAALAKQARERLTSQAPKPREPIDIAPQSERPIRGNATQEAFGRALLELASEPGIAERIVTTAPDVSVSTNLGGWINRFGVYAPAEEPDFTAGEALRWKVGPEGRHIELGISEMNLFLLLGQLGLSHELTGELLLPIGTVYDPFVCRGLDALIYSVYSDSRFVIAGTPSGISLSREGGAHQSIITPSIGIELPGITYAEPAFAMEVDWLLRDGLRRLSEPDGESLYLRLSTKPIDQAPFEQARKAMGDEALREAVLAGGYWLEVGTGSGPGVTLVASGAMIPEALEAAAILDSDEGIVASVLAVTSPDRLYRGWRAAQMAPLSDAHADRPQSHLEMLFEDQPEPIVSVIDGASHALAFIGSALGQRQVTLGVDRFGQSGSLPDVYEAYDLSADAIASAAVAALTP